MKFKGKRIVLTGAGNGIGRELACGIVERGGSVLGIDINAKALEETKGLLADDKRQDFEGAVLDVSSREAVMAFRDKVSAEQAPVDGLINCAGIIQPFLKLDQLDDEAIERVFNVNWFGTLYMTRAFLPTLQTRPEAHLANVGSLSSIAPLPGQAIYGASKAAVKLLTETVYTENMGTNLNVTLILPGAVATNISGNSGVKMEGKALREEGESRNVEDVSKAAKTILDGIEANAYRVLVDKLIQDIDGLYRQDPERAAAVMADNFGGLLKR